MWVLVFSPPTRVIHTYYVLYPFSYDSHTSQRIFDVSLHIRLILKISFTLIRTVNRSLRCLGLKTTSRTDRGDAITVTKITVEFACGSRYSKAFGRLLMTPLNLTWKYLLR